MLNPFTLPVLGGSLLAAVAIGIHLGESSIGLIKPIYFQGPALHPRERGAAIDPNELSRSSPRPSYAGLYGWEQGAEALAAARADCGGCDAPRARDASVYSAVVPWFGGRDEPRRAAPPTAPAVDAEIAARAEAWDREQAARERKRDIDRYAHYPVTRREARAYYQRADRYLDAAPRRWRDDDRDDDSWRDDERGDGRAEAEPIAYEEALPRDRERRRRFGDSWRY